MVGQVKPTVQRSACPRSRRVRIPAADGVHCSCLGLCGCAGGVNFSVACLRLWDQEVVSLVPASVLCVSIAVLSAGVLSLPALAFSCWPPTHVGACDGVSGLQATVM